MLSDSVLTTIHNTTLEQLSITSVEKALAFKEFWSSVVAEYDFYVMDDSDVSNLWNRIRDDNNLFRFILNLGCQLHFKLGALEWSQLKTDLTLAFTWLHNDGLDDMEQIADTVFAQQTGDAEWLAARLNTDPWLIMVLLTKFIPFTVFKFVRLMPEDEE